MQLPLVRKFLLRCSHPDKASARTTFVRATTPAEKRESQPTTRSYRGGVVCTQSAAKYGSPSYIFAPKLTDRGALFALLLQSLRDEHADVLCLFVHIPTKLRDVTLLFFHGKGLGRIAFSCLFGYKLVSCTLFHPIGLLSLICVLASQKNKVFKKSDHPSLLADDLPYASLQMRPGFRTGTSHKAPQYTKKVRGA